MSESDMKEAINALESDFKSMRSNRVNASMLDIVKADVNSSSTPLNHIASVSVEGSRTLVLNVWDKNNVPAVEKSLMEHSTILGASPQTAGTVIRVAVAALTAETREKLAAEARKRAEVARIQLRQIRKKSNDALEKEELSDDEKRQELQEIQKLTDEYVKKVDDILKAKEDELKKI